MIFEIFARQVIGDLPIRAKTRATYLSMVNCHVTPLLGKCRLTLLLEAIYKALFGGCLHKLLQ